MNRLVLTIAGCACLLVSTGSVLAESPADASYRIGEARRLDLMSRQVDLNYRMNWLHGFGPGLLDPFEPWPLVPGDIWGYPGPRPVEQPVGQVTEQLGKNRWYSRPVYAAEAAQRSARPLAVSPPSKPAANDAVPEPPRPSDLDEDPTAPRAIKKASGPRAF